MSEQKEPFVLLLATTEREEKHCCCVLNFSFSVCFFKCTFAWQALVISVRQTGIQDEDVTFTAPPFCPSVPLPPLSPESPHPPRLQG